MGILQSGSEHCRPGEEGSRVDVTADHGSAQGKGRVGVRGQRMWPQWLRVQ